MLRFSVLACLGYILYSLSISSGRPLQAGLLATDRLQEDYATCAKLRTKPEDPSGHRNVSARYVEGVKPVLIQNATVWTGEPDADTGNYSWARLDVLLQYGLIQKVSEHISKDELPDEYDLVEAAGRQLTSGIIDMHSHTGVDSLPDLQGNDDTNELSKDITPYVRSLDGFNPLDPQFQVIKSGGVTTSLILPGSGNNIGGEAFVVKHAVGKANGRPELSIESLLADPDRNHRYIKMACGENAKRVYGKAGRNFGPFSRLGEAWEFRHAFEQAAALKNSQDDWCATADAVGAEKMTTYLPKDLQWETLAAVLRGQVMVNTHCYTIPDLESFIGYTNEFKFPVRAFHHAHSTYLIPDVLKRAYGGRAPAAALFADNMNYKAEAYVASEQAGKILYDEGITPVYVSDNPVINAQHVVFEAAKAHRYGLPYHAALAGVTSASAELLGLGSRIGKVKPGYDADVTLWDSDPLSVGATPVQVFIDGVPQFKDPVELQKPVTPSMETTDYPVLVKQDNPVNSVVFTGISKIHLPGLEHTRDLHENASLVVANGKIVCAGPCEHAISATSNIIALSDGYITPPLTAFGSLLGLEEIAAEADTSDGSLSEDSFSHAVDGLRFEGKNLAAAYNHGVTKAITAPKFAGTEHKGISVAFRTGAKHALEKHAIVNPAVALHYTLTSDAKQGKTPTISSAIADLRSKLLNAIPSPNDTKGDEEKKQQQQPLQPEDLALSQVVNGTLPLVISVHSADTIASLIRLKHEIESAINISSPSSSSSSSSSSPQPKKLNLILLGASESHLLAHELSSSSISIILSPLFSYATTWDQRRALPGAPLSNGTAIDVLHNAGVRVAIGVDEDWEARDLFLQAGIVHANSGGKIGEEEALDMVSRGIEEMMGLKGESGGGEEEEDEDEFSEFVVFEGNPLTIGGQIRAVAGGDGGVRIWS